MTFELNVPLRKIYFKVCILAWVYALEHRYPCILEELNFPGAGVIHPCEPAGMDAGNPTGVLYKSSVCS